MASNDAREDYINHPTHYTLGSIEVYDFITAWDLNFTEGNIIKYIIRAPHKGTKIKDLKKAQWYLNRLIENAESESFDHLTGVMR